MSKAFGTELGLAIAGELLHAKLTGQATILRTHFSATAVADAVDDLRDALADASDIDAARQLEAAAATLYWNAWIGRDDTSPKFATRDRARFPKHWTTMEGRRSLLATSHGNRRAERPTNAIINYLNALAEVEATIACHIVGLDPARGLLHLDARNRQSLALDLLEPLRPIVEAYVLEVLTKRTFRRSDFTELPDGHVRILAPLTHELAKTMPRWAKAVAPHAEHVAHILGAHLDGDYIPTTRLTRANQREAGERVKARRAATRLPVVPIRRQRPKLDVPTTPSATCVVCGGPIERRGHVRCPECRANRPPEEEAARRKRGRAIAASRADLERWRREHPDAEGEPELFRREILPGLAHVKLSEIVAACGVTKSWASMIRSGQKTPALRHWPALADLSRRLEFG